MSQIAIVLGGGAARGYAHIGVLKVIEEIGVKPDIVVGCSMGSIVGGFYAYGYSPEEMEPLALQMDLPRTLKLLTPRPGITGFIDGNHPLEFFKEMLGEDTNIEDLKVTYAAVAYDLLSREELVFTEGNLAYAIRASMSIPGVFPPLDFGDAILVDGGVIDPVPVSAARLLGADKIIAVNVLPRYGIKMAKSNMNNYLQMKHQNLSGEKRRFFPAFPTIKMDIKRRMEMNAAVIGMMAIGVMESGIIDLNFKDSQPDLIIDVDVPIKMHEFHKAKNAIDAGVEAAQKSLNELKALLEQTI